MANKGKWRLTVRKDFSASHALRNYNGKCENMHGHNFIVEAVVEGERLDPDVEIILDFKLIKEALAAAIAPLDHANLNQVPPFDNINPSSENLSRYVFRALAPRMKQYGVRLVQISVSEKEGQSATYIELESAS